MEISTFFDERLSEVDAYLDLLHVMEEGARSGNLQFSGTTKPLTSAQQKMMYSGVYLQLYNLVEATMTKCIDAVTEAAASDARWAPSDLAPELRREWIRAIARTHVELNHEHRLRHAIELCSYFVDSLPLGQFSVEKGGGGNWDDASIEALARRIGLQVRADPDVYSKVKQKIRDDLGPLQLVTRLRNRLAHGDISFVECAGEVDWSALKNLRDVTADYMRAVVQCFSAYLRSFEFLIPARRPTVEEVAAQ